MHWTDSGLVSFRRLKSNDGTHPGMAWAMVFQFSAMMLKEAGVAFGSKPKLEYREKKAFERKDLVSYDTNRSTYVLLKFRS